MNNLRIGARLGLGFGILLALLLTVALLGISRMGSIQGNLDEIVNVNGRQAGLAFTMRATVQQMGSVARNIVLLSDPAELQAEVNRMRTVLANYDKADAELNRMFTADPSTAEEEKSLLARSREFKAQAQPSLERVVQLGQSNQNAEATRVLMTEYVKAQAAWVSAIDALADYEEKLNQDSAVAAERSYGIARNVMLAISATALLLGVLIAWRMTVSITRPIARAVGIAQTVAGGDLTSRIDVDSKDETGQLLAALKAMNAALVQVVSQVRSASDSISTGATQIATGNVDLSQRTEEQASNLEETAASMEELTSTVKSNADTARQANQLAGSASGVAAKGGEVVSQVVSTMEDITTSSRKISDIIGVIDGIAFQTNILALNAAVEAARAGEQGRGFAVVASEVRSLASRSAEAAKEIKALIGASVERVEAGSRLVADAGSTMADIVSQVRRVTDLIAEISAATNEQSSGITQVSEAVTQLDQVTQQNAALVEESAAAAESLNQQARLLVEAVSVFRLQDGQAGAALAAPVAAVPTGAAVRRTASPPLRPASHGGALPAARAPALERRAQAARSLPVDRRAPATTPVKAEEEWESF